MYNESTSENDLINYDMSVTKFLLQKATDTKSMGAFPQIFTTKLWLPNTVEFSRRPFGGSGYHGVLWPAQLQAGQLACIVCCIGTLDNVANLVFFCKQTQLPFPALKKIPK